MRVSEATRPVASTPRLPAHDKLGRLVARSLGLDEPTLREGLRPATVDDLPDVLALRREHLLPGHEWDDDAYLRWRYRLGREGAGFGELWCVRAHGRVLATIGVEDLPVDVDGQSLTGAQVMDLLVRPEAQESGLGIWLNQAMLARHPFTLAVGANQNSAGIVRRLFEPLAPRLTFTHPLDLGPFVRRRWPTLAGTPLVTRVANAGLSLRRLALHWGRPRGFTVESATRLDPELTAPVSRGAAGVHLRHHGAYLQRRLLDNPRRPLALRVVRRGDTVAGLIAWAVEADDLGRPELHLIDWRHDGDEALLVLLHEALREAAAQGCTCVRLLLQDTASQRVAARAGFLPSSDDEGRPCGVQSRDAELAARLAHAPWALTDLHDDADGF